MEILLTASGLSRRESACQTPEIFRHFLFNLFFILKMGRQIFVNFLPHWHHIVEVHAPETTALDKKDNNRHKDNKAINIPGCASLSDLTVMVP